MAIANIDIVLVLALIFSDDESGSNGNAISRVIQPWDSGAKWLLAIAITIVILALNTFVKIKGIHVFQGLSSFRNGYFYTYGRYISCGFSAKFLTVASTRIPLNIDSSETLYSTTNVL